MRGFWLSKMAAAAGAARALLWSLRREATAGAEGRSSRSATWRASSRRRRRRRGNRRLCRQHVGGQDADPVSPMMTFGVTPTGVRSRKCHGSCVRPHANDAQQGRQDRGPSRPCMSFRLNGVRSGLPRRAWPLPAIREKAGPRHLRGGRGARRRHAAWRARGSGVLETGCRDGLCHGTLPRSARAPENGAVGRGEPPDLLPVIEANPRTQWPVGPPGGGQRDGTAAADRARSKEGRDGPNSPSRTATEPAPASGGKGRGCDVPSCISVP